MFVSTDVGMYLRSSVYPNASAIHDFFFSQCKQETLSLFSFRETFFTDISFFSYMMYIFLSPRPYFSHIPFQMFLPVTEVYERIILSLSLTYNQRRCLVSVRFYSILHLFNPLTPPHL